MMRKLLVLCVVGSVAACSSGGTSPVFTAIKGVILPSKDEGPTAPPMTLTRERIVASGLAAVRARIEGEEVSNILSATSLNTPYVTYVSAFRQSITMIGGLVTASRGLGGDMLSVRNDANDPIAILTPVADWPSDFTRDYRFPGVGPEGMLIPVSCKLIKGSASEITIVEVSYEVTEFTEVCDGQNVSFSNTYYAETETGQIWQSRQWTGAKRGYLNIEVLEPFTLD